MTNKKQTLSEAMPDLELVASYFDLDLKYLANFHLVREVVVDMNMKINLLTNLIR